MKTAVTVSEFGLPICSECHEICNIEDESAKVKICLCFRQASTCKHPIRLDDWKE